MKNINWLNEYNLYKRAGISQNISQDDLEIYFEKLLKENHPSSFTFKLISLKELNNKKEKYKSILESYSVLSDDSIRSKYDNLLNSIDLSDQNKLKEVLTKILAIKKEKPFKDRLYVINEKDPYIILNVDSDIPKSDLNKHYKSLVKKYHPDKYSFKYMTKEELVSLNKIFSKISYAYQFLSDDEKRKSYDDLRKRKSAESISDKVPVNNKTVTKEPVGFDISKIDPEKAKLNQAESFFKKGVDLYNSNLLDKAIVEFKNSIEINSKVAKYHLYLAYCLEKKGWKQYAKSEYKSVLIFDPNNKIAATKLKNMATVVKPEKKSFLGKIKNKIFKS